MLKRLKEEDVKNKIPNFSLWTEKCMGWKNKYDTVKKEFF